jgi:uncharacterized oligopeptide transporter (OPT) family protein
MAVALGLYVPRRVTRVVCIGVGRPWTTKVKRRWFDVDDEDDDDEEEERTITSGMVKVELK